MVASVDPRGPGAEAGLLQGDVVVSWDGKPMAGGVRALLRELGPESVGRTVEVGLRRGGQDLRLSLTVGERPAAG